MNSTVRIASFWLIILITLVFIPPVLADDTPPDDVESAAQEVPLHDEEPSGVNEPLAGKEAVPDDYDSFVFEAPPLIFEVPSIELRSLDYLFPDLSPEDRAVVTGNRGARHAFEKDGGSPAFIPSPDSGISLLGKVMAKKPSHIIEALLLIPYNKRKLDFLDIYNALGKIKNIQDHTLFIRGASVKMFVDTTRIESAQKRRPIADPPHAEMLPYSETMYLRFIDQYIGDLYLRGEITVGSYGITYSLSNFRDVTYSIFRIMKAETFSAIIYLEPVKEGILVYSMSGIYIPKFIAHRVNLTPNMNNRITVLVNWIKEGLMEEEDYVFQRNYIYKY